MPYPNTVDSGGIAPWYLAHEFNADATSAGAGALTANTTYLVGVYLPVYAVIANMRVRHSTTSAGNLDMGIYDSGGTLLDHTGSVAASSASTVQNTNLSNGNLALAPGRYYLALWVDNSTDTYYKVSLSAVNTAFGNAKTGTNTNSGGLLSSFTAMGGTSTSTGILVLGLMGIISGTGF